MVSRSPVIPLFIFGAGGHARVIHSVAISLKSYAFKGYVVPTPEKEDKSKASPLIAEDIFMSKKQVKNTAAALGFGENHLRRKIAQRLEESPLTFPAIRHPSAIIAPDVKIGRGTVIMPGAIINTGAVIGDFCIVNTGAVIEHDCMLEDFCSVAPNATVCGGCHIGTGAYIGASATILQGIKIGSHSVVGAGSVATKNTAAKTVNVGAPAKKIRTRKENEAVY